MKTTEAAASNAKDAIAASGVDYGVRMGGLGLAKLDETILEKRENGMTVGRDSEALPDICEGLFLDEAAFILVPGRDPNFPIQEKLTAAPLFELGYHKCMMYFAGRLWSAKEIVDNLNKRLAIDGRTRTVRMGFSQLVRCQIISSFTASTKADRGTAVSALKLAVELLEEGGKKWAHIPYDDKGNYLWPTYVRLVRTRLLNALLHACRDAFTPSAKRMFTVEAVEKLAKEIIAENDESKWPPHREDRFDRLPYYRSHAPLAELGSKPNQMIFANLKEAKLAAEAYDKAASLQDDQWHGRGQTLWFALECHLRAGNTSTIGELWRRAEEAERVTIEIEKIWQIVPSIWELRKFTRIQVDALKHSLPPSQRNAAKAIRIKAIPSVRLPGGPPSQQMAMQVQQSPVWPDKPGGVALVDYQEGGGR
ncbi:hypothetical protein JCM8547_002291 [Rhodosporidiobolus lusitaniae]